MQNAMKYEDLVALIALACDNAKKSQDEIQQVAIEILLSAYHSGKFGLATKLITDLPEGVRKKALVEWFTKFLCGVVVDEKEGKFTGAVDKDALEASFEQAKATKWWTLKPEPAFKGFDLQAEMAKLLKKAHKSVEAKADLERDGKLEDASKVNVDLTMLKKLDMAFGKVQEEAEKPAKAA